MDRITLTIRVSLFCVLVILLSSCTEPASNVDSTVLSGEYAQLLKEALEAKEIPYEAEQLSPGFERISYSRKYAKQVNENIMGGTPPPEGRSAGYIPATETEKLKRKLQIAGIPYQTTVYRMVEHVIWKEEHSAAVNSIINRAYRDGPYGEARLLMDLGRKEEGYSRLSDAVRQGDAGAMYFLANQHLLGRDVEQDFRRALELLHAAAAAGETQAYTALGQAYHYGRGTSRDDIEALDWFERAAAEGETLAMWMIGVFHRDGHAGLTRDRDAAGDWFNKARAAGGDYSYIHGDSSAQPPD